MQYTPSPLAASTDILPASIASWIYTDARERMNNRAQPEPRSGMSVAHPYKPSPGLVSGLSCAAAAAALAYGGAAHAAGHQLAHHWQLAASSTPPGWLAARGGLASAASPIPPLW